MSATSYPATGPLTLRANIAQYPTTEALVQGKIASGLVTLELAGLKHVHTGFKGMLRKNAYDVSEMAVATFLQAHEFGKAFSLLPVVVLGRFQHYCIGYNSDIYPVLAPQDLAGKRVAIRSYTQTTGMWVRGILQDEYGLDPDSVTWVCFDQPHVAEYTDPTNVEWAPEGKDPVNMLLDGEVDAAILGMNMPDDPRVRTLIPEPQRQAEAWHARTQVVPPNHFIIVPNALCDERPDVIREVIRMFVESRNASGAFGKGFDAAPIGIEANRKALELAIRYASQQHMITKPVAVDDLFHPVMRDIAP